MVAAAPQPGDTLVGEYRITSAGAAKVERWAGVFKEPEGSYKKIERIDVARAAGSRDLVVSVGTRGPYTLRASGTRSWTRPLKRGFQVTVTHQPRGERPDALRVRVGPISIIYVHD